MLTGVLMAAWQYLEPRVPGVFLFIDLALLIAMIGILLVLRREGRGRLALYALVAIVIGSLVYDLSEVISVLGYAAGLVLLAVAVWKVALFPRWVPVLWVVVSLVVIPAYFIAGPESLAITFGGVLFGLSFVGAGYALLKGSAAPAEALAA